MRIMQVTPRYFPNVGGVEVVVQKLSESLVQKGFEAVVLSVDLSGRLPAFEQVNGVVVKRFAPLVGDPLYLPEPRFVSALRDENVDVVHVHNIHTLLPVVVSMFCRPYQKVMLQPYYHQFGQSRSRQALLDLYKRGATRLVFPKTSLFIANSIYEKRIFQEDFSEAGNVFLVPIGLDIKDVARVKHKPVEPKRVLYVGALKPYKNVDKVLAGFAHLLAEGHRDFRLVVVGRGNEAKPLHDLARSLGVEGSVEWKDYLSREELLGEYAKASVVVLLSPLESFSIVVYEALVIGVPVVVLTYGPLAHLVASGHAEGLNSLNRERVAEALLRAVQKRYARLSLSSGEFMDWNSYANKLVDIYERLTGCL